MNDYELVSGLIDALTYVIPILLGIVLLVIGLSRKRKGKGKGSAALVGLGGVLLVVFGLGAVGRALTLASQSTSAPTVLVQSPLQPIQPGAISTTPTVTVTPSAAIPSDPLSPAQHVWCLASDENRARVVLAALLLDLDDALPDRQSSGDGYVQRGGYEAEIRRILADDNYLDELESVSSGIGPEEFRERSRADSNSGFVLELAASLGEGDHWLRQRANVDGPEPGDQPSPWAISCAAAREAFDS